MKVADQIRSRMEQLGVGVPELAKRVKCSPQTIRYWISGRNMPNKRRCSALEQALSFSIDWSEGAAPAGPKAQVLLSQDDVQLMIKVSTLPVPVKQALSQLVDAINGDGTVIRSVRRETRTSMRAFADKSHETGNAKKQGGRKVA